MTETLTNASVAAARTAMLAAIAPLAEEPANLSDACGRALSQDIVAHRDQPPFPASAMDGYALRATDTPGLLSVVGESAAGAGPKRQLGAGEAMRIFTGAPVPEGANAVAIQEDVTRSGETISAPATPEGQHVRPRGVDFRAGAVLLAAGTRLDPIAIALAAAAGRGDVPVRRRPRVVVLAGGDEIVPPGSAPGRYQVFDSISLSLCKLIEAWGGKARALAPALDDRNALAHAFAAAFADADLTVTIGGASVGDRDLMKPALEAFAPRFVVDRINVRPGKPTWFATTPQAPILGLPGNPASALVCAHLFLRPLLARFAGAAKTEPAYKPARLSSDLPANGPREHFLRARLCVDDAGQRVAAPAESQDSSLLSVFQAADALIRLPPKAPPLAAGALVDVLDLDRPS